ncbi:hypothetical protein EIN_224440 [Entamoeba invadens IP1]|uniref:Uncharacterized protein n=1 Tax=Entamoeba invadens IP1 TaxID=370355 RepID=A0A0A1U2A2_ENTIV|nr:hypothetical protein EIN_224440 [Entamoeba invadens IP1]ELP88201.1 hypothetical protein EIN_224440 [Entamoeba invadens IP1]|eukprot:XP_004254972.1 hypothetical protein EIN_224440 [Entamoeba invadens IP1]
MTSETIQSSECMSEEVVGDVMNPIAFCVEGTNLKGGLENLNTVILFIRYTVGNTHIKMRLTKGSPVVLNDITKRKITLYMTTKTQKIGEVILTDELVGFVSRKNYLITFDERFLYTNPQALQSTVSISFSCFTLLQIQDIPGIDFMLTKCLDFCARPDVFLSFKYQSPSQNLEIEIQSKLLLKPRPIFCPFFQTHPVTIKITQNATSLTSRLYSSVMTCHLSDYLRFQLVTIPPTPVKTVVLDQFLTSINWRNSVLTKRKTSFHILDFDEEGRVVIKEETTFPGYFVRIDSKLRLLEIWATSDLMGNWISVEEENKERIYETTIYEKSKQQKIVTQFTQYQFEATSVTKVCFGNEEMKSFSFQIYELEQFSESIVTPKQMFTVY